MNISWLLPSQPLLPACCIQMWAALKPCSALLGFTRAGLRLFGAELLCWRHKITFFKQSRDRCLIKSITADKSALKGKRLEGRENMEFNSAQEARKAKKSSPTCCCCCCCLFCCCCCDGRRGLAHQFGGTLKPDQCRNPEVLLSCFNGAKCWSAKCPSLDQEKLSVHKKHKHLQQQSKYSPQCLQ